LEIQIQKHFFCLFQSSEFVSELNIFFGWLWDFSNNQAKNKGRRTNNACYKQASKTGKAPRSHHEKPNRFYYTTRNYKLVLNATPNISSEFSTF
jgi:hypothetical protein